LYSVSSGRQVHLRGIRLDGSTTAWLKWCWRGVGERGHGREPGEGARAPKGDGEGARPVRARLGLQFGASSGGGVAPVVRAPGADMRRRKERKKTERSVICVTSGSGG